MAGDSSHTNQNNNYRVPYNDCAYDKFMCDIDPDYNYFNAIQSKLNSNYFSESTFNSTYGRNSNFSMFHLNIRSLHAHYNELLCYLDTLDIDFKIIALSETALNNSSIKYTIPNYNCEINYRVKKKGGGVSLYIHNMFQYKLRTDLQFGGDVNSIFIEILYNSSNTKRNIICGCIYRPPQMSLHIFNELLSQMFGKIQHENKYVYLVGDFNVNTLPHIKGTLATQEFKNIFSANYCFPLITNPTRVSNHSATLIDQIYTNVTPQNMHGDAGILRISISDHYGIFCINKNCKVTIDQSVTIKRSFNNKNRAQFNHCLRNQTWDTVYDSTDMQSAYSEFQRVIDLLLNQCFKVQTFAMNYKTRHAWMTEALRNQIKLKNRLYTEAISSGDNELMKEYKNTKRDLQSSLRNCEIKYYSDELELNQRDMTKTWKVIRMILGLNSNNSRQKLTLNINNNTVTDSKQIANAFNNFFVSIGPQLARGLAGDTNPLLYVKHINNSMVMLDVTSMEVENVINSLKNASPGPDEFPAFVGKECLDSIIEPLTHLINISFRSGVFPSELKLAKVVPIFKSGDSSSVNNYRPISVLSFFSKVFERVVYNRVLDFLCKNNVLYDYQFGFRQKHSAQHALITLIDKIHTSLDNGDIAITILLDLKKAFDTVNHQILLQKLNAYGIRGNMLKWFESYLTDRSQYVVYDGIKSDIYNVTCGVPQGSILGPLLFILNMNDICNASELLFTILYADDTCVLLSGKDLTKLIMVINAELKSLSAWFRSNKLTVNTQKTFFMIFHRSRIKYDSKHCIKMDDC